MYTPALNYKLIKKIKDERFDEDQIHQYHLLLNIGTRDMQVGVIDSQENRMLLLEDYVFPSLSSHDELLQVLKNLFEDHAFLLAAFWGKIKISIKNNKFVQVPEALFLEEAAPEYLKFNAHINTETEDVLFVKNSGLQAVTVFAIQKDLRQWIQSLYRTNTPVFLHQSSVLIDGVTKFIAKRKDDHLYIYVDRFKLHILSFQDKKLIYYNQFTIKQFSEYIKYIMLVMKSLGLNQRTSQVMLWGYIGKNSPHYHEFYKYINNINFGYRPAYMSYGYMFDELQDHHFFDLFSMHLSGNTRP